MPLFVVTYDHPDEEGWQKHVAAHRDYLADLLKTGILRASGPFKGTPYRTAMLIIAAEDREDLDRIIARDPFFTEGLIEGMTVKEWDPIYGAFNRDSSRPRE